jgi:hypothetical protein
MSLMDTGWLYTVVQAGATFAALVGAFFTTKILGIASERRTLQNRIHELDQEIPGRNQSIKDMQEELDGMREASRSAKAKRDIKMRQHLMERSYARGTWYGFDRARWRGLWRVQIQEYLIAAIQNIQVLLRHGSYFKRSPSVMMEQIKGVIPEVIRSLLDSMELMSSKMGRIVPFGSIYPRLSVIET